MPKLSIIIPVYNAEPFLLELMDSIERQAFRDCEVLFVDDCSSDGSLALLRNMPGALLLERPSNSGGCSVPRNDGIRAARGDYIAIFDADDIMEPGKLAAQVDLLDSCPDVDFVFTDFVNFSEGRMEDRHTKACKEFRAVAKKKVGPFSFIIDSRDAYRTLIAENFIGASSMMFRKRLIDKIGLFNPLLQSSEDIDFSFRAAANGNLGYIDVVGHRRRLHSTNMTKNSRKMLKCRLSVLQSELVRNSDDEIGIKLRRSMSEVYYALGYDLRESGELRESFEMLARAIRSNWRNVAAYKCALKGLLYGLTLRNPKTIAESGARARSE